MYFSIFYLLSISADNVILGVIKHEFGVLLPMYFLLNFVHIPFKALVLV